jgi:hypothetical protein
MVKGHAGGQSGALHCALGSFCTQHGVACPQVIWPRPIEQLTRQGPPPHTTLHIPQVQVTSQDDASAHRMLSVQPVGGAHFTSHAMPEGQVQPALHLVSIRQIPATQELQGLGQIGLRSLVLSRLASRRAASIPGPASRARPSDEPSRDTLGL